jgi:hypothetical protein
MKKEMAMRPPLKRPTPRLPLWVFLLIAALLTGILSACGTAQQADQAQGPSDACGPYEPTDADVQKMLAYGREAFASPGWVKNYTVEPYKITLTRRNDAIQAIAYSEYLIFTCGYTQSDLNNYFNDEGFNIIFNDYEAHVLTKFCEQSGTPLYEYDLLDEGNNFKARYWVKQDTNTRILVYMLVFPQADAGGLNEHSQKLFPTLSACP